MSNKQIPTNFEDNEIEEDDEPNLIKHFLIRILTITLIPLCFFIFLCLFPSLENEYKMLNIVIYYPLVWFAYMLLETIAFHFQKETTLKTINFLLVIEVAFFYAIIAHNLI
jgi:hypothetical protein